MSKQLDNSTLTLKARIRRKVLATCHNPIILETHAGTGGIYERCYRGVVDGVAIERQPRKTAVLVEQRPTWAVYEGDAVRLLSLRAGAHLAVNMLDVDPYGSPFDTIEAFLGSERPLPETLHIVVNDGLRQKVRVTGIGDVKCLQPMLPRFGNHVFPVYLEVAKEMVRMLGRKRGYELVGWYGYYCGHMQNMTHYWGILKR